MVVICEDKYNKSYNHPKFAKRANHVVIEHNDGTVAVYAHLQHSSLKVKVGQKVRRGQIIGLCGQTGYATYPHLHFGLYGIDGTNVKINFL